MLGRLMLLNLAVLAAGCGAQVTTTSTPAATTRQIAIASGGPTRCSVWLQGHLAEIYFSSRTVQVQSACDRWVQVQAAAGQLWDTNHVAAVPTAAEHLVCLLEAGPLLATVDDGQGGFYGQQACNALLATGAWRELNH